MKQLIENSYNCHLRFDRANPAVWRGNESSERGAGGAAFQSPRRQQRRKWAEQKRRIEWRRSIPAVGGVAATPRRCHSIALSILRTRPRAPTQPLHTHEVLPHAHWRRHEQYIYPAVPSALNLWMNEADCISFILSWGWKSTNFCFTQEMKLSFCSIDPAAITMQYLFEFLLIMR